MADFDTSEVHDLARVFGRAAGSAAKDVRPVVQKGLLNIKTGARRRVAGIRHAPSYPAAITYESHDTPTGARGEVGPDKEKRQGALGNIFEHGTVKNAPIPHMLPEANLEEPRFNKALQDVAAEPFE
jgi:hypothetical protein